MQSNKFTTTLFMQLNSTSTSDSNADLLTYNYVRDTEIRMTEQYKNSINDLKDTIKAEAQRSQDNFGKLDGQIGKLEGKLDGQMKEFLNNKFALVLVVLLVASMQPDIRSLISIIIKFVNVWIIYDYEFFAW